MTRAAHSLTLACLLSGAVPALAFVLAGCATFEDRCPCSAVSRTDSRTRPGGPPQRPGAPRGGSSVDFTQILDPCACVRELSEPGEGVTLLTANQVGSDCQTLARLRTGFYEPVRFETAAIMLRNLAAETGANAVAVDAFEPGGAEGRALQCSAQFISERRTAESAGEANSSEAPVWVDEGEVMRNRNQRLGWLKCSAGQQIVDGRCEGQAVAMKWPEAADYCGRLRLSDRRWRLPTYDELATILDPTIERGAALVDGELFPQTRRSVYWSSTFFESQRGVIRVVDFDSGLNYAYGVRNPAYTRCVFDTP